jgi:signal transduction histidine kinase
VGDWYGTWAGRGRRIAAAPLAPAVSGALLGILAVAETLARTSGTGVAAGPTRLALVVTALATTVPLGLLWSRPALAAPAVTAAAVISLAAFHTLTVAGLLAQPVALYRLGRHGSPVLAAVTAMPYLVVALAHPQHGTAGTFLILLASLAPVAAWAGIARRARSEAVAHSAARQVIAGSLLEHTARGERARISRELHDVVAHHISMIAVQAESARLTTPGMPAAGAMRRLLGVLREDTRDDDLPGRQPQPGLHQLAELLDATRDASGAGARLIIRGRLPGLDPGVELAAYRIVQEALTNARRHAPGAAVDVELHHTGQMLAVRIRDNGPGPPLASPDGGHGLAGMRERAAAVGGELRTGEAPGGGFLVIAKLPAEAEEMAG